MNVMLGLTKLCLQTRPKFPAAAQQFRHYGETRARSVEQEGVDTPHRSPDTPRDPAERARDSSDGLSPSAVDAISQASGKSSEAVGAKGYQEQLKQQQRQENMRWVDTLLHTAQDALKRPSKFKEHVHSLFSDMSARNKREK